MAGLREVLPFLICVLIYTNLHDTIGFVNGRDVHWYLDALDRQLLGVQPVVWAERLITPVRTEVMSVLYLNFFWIAPSTSVLLLARRDWRAFRAATLAVIVCFYLGYALYVIFPAAPPRLVLVYEFSRTLQGYPTPVLEPLRARVRAAAGGQPRRLPFAARRGLAGGACVRLAVRAGLVLDAAPVRARAVGLDDLPAPPLRGGPAGRLRAGAAGAVASPRSWTPGGPPARRPAATRPPAAPP